MMQRFLLILPFALLLSACQPTPPQIPSYRSSTGRAQSSVDSALLGMLELNDRLREEADHQLALLATADMAQEEEGYWIKGKHDIDTGLKDQERITLCMSIYDLDSTLLDHIEQDFVVGNTTTLPAVSSALPMLHVGDSVTLLVPWYLGYGVTGNTRVPGYTNLRIEMTIKK